MGLVSDSKGVEAPTYDYKSDTTADLATSEETFALV